MNGEEQLRREMIALLPRMKRFALSLTRSGQDSEDLLQQTYERAIRSLDSFEPGTRLDSWMYRIMQNLNRNRLRDRGTRERTIVSGMENADAAVDGVSAADARLEMIEIQRYMANLDDDHRNVLMLVAIEGHGYGEVAAMLGVPIGTVTSRLARARLKLRAFMDARRRTLSTTDGLQQAGGKK